MSFTITETESRDFITCDTDLVLHSHKIEHTIEYKNGDDVSSINLTGTEIVYAKGGRVLSYDVSISSEDTLTSTYTILDALEIDRKFLTPFGHVFCPETPDNTIQVFRAWRLLVTFHANLKGEQDDCYTLEGAINQAKYILGRETLGPHDFGAKSLLAQYRALTPMKSRIAGDME